MEQQRTSTLDQARLRTRVAVREVRAAARQWRSEPGWDTPFAACLVDQQELIVRRPQLSDGPEWRAQRLALRDRLEPWWPTDDSWDSAHSPLAWAEQCTRLRRACRSGLAQPNVILVDGVFGGQLGVDAIDRGTNSGELSAWTNAAIVPSRCVRLAAVMVCLRAFTGLSPLDRLTAPVAIENPRAAGAVAAIGFRQEAVLKSYRMTKYGRSDHQLWCIHRDDETIAALSRLADSLRGNHVAASLVN